MKIVLKDEVRPMTVFEAIPRNEMFCWDSRIWFKNTEGVALCIAVDPERGATYASKLGTVLPFDADTQVRAVVRAEFALEG